MKKLSFVLLLLVSTALFATQADQEKIRIQDALNKGSGDIYFLPDVELGNNQQLIKWSAGDGGIYSTDDISIGLDSDADGAAESFKIYRDGATYGLGDLLYQLDNSGNVIHPINNQYMKFTGGYGAIISKAGFYLNLDYDNNASGESFFIYKDSDSIGGGTKLFSFDEAGLGYFSEKIGIGSETPASVLEVVKTIGSGQLVNFYETSGSNYDVFKLKTDALGAATQKLLSLETDTDGTPTERFSAFGDGDIYVNKYVGIGTNDPGYQLDIKSASSTAFINLNPSDGSNSGILLKENGVDKWGLISQTGDADDKFHFYNSSSAKVLTILQDGNIGVGSETPGEKLDVNGSIKATSVKTDSLLNSDGTGAPPGVMPIGGMIAVMPTIHANAWQVPASGVIKDGFMLADGHQITAQNVTDGSLFPAGTYLPNMVSMVARGGTTSCDGSIACQAKAGGNDSATLSMNNIPQHNHGATGLTGAMTAATFEHGHSLSGSVAGGTASLTGTTTFVTGINNHTNLALSDHTFTNPYMPKHYHSEANHSTGLTIDNTSHSHTIDKSNWNQNTGSSGVATNRDNWSSWGGNATAVPAFSGSYAGFAYTLAGSDHQHSMSWSGNATTNGISGTSNAISGYVGEDESGSCNGDESNTCQTTGGSVSAHSFSQNISAHSVNTSAVGISSTGANNGTLDVGADDITTDRTVSIGGNTANAGQASPTAVDTLPNYQNVVWVIRVY